RYYIVKSKLMNLSTNESNIKQTIEEVVDYIIGIYKNVLKNNKLTLITNEAFCAMSVGQVKEEEFFSYSNEIIITPKKLLKWAEKTKIEDIKIEDKRKICEFIDSRIIYPEKPIELEEEK
ncbi:MAG: hypothetical protein WCX32_04205, partial [Clostridia bacterium]